jgi:hypothetical protein
LSTGRQHTVVQGESVESIAHAAGHVWETVWDAPENADLRELRKSPHVVMPGDVVFVPPIKLKTEEVATGQRHTVRLKAVPSKLIVRFLVDGEPRANAEYTFVMPGIERTGTTNGDGVLEESVDPQAEWAEVRFELEAAQEDDEDLEPVDDEDEDEDEDDPPQDVYRFYLRHMDPSSEVTGVQGRLHLLGYGVGAIDGELGPRTQAALRAFQAEHELEVTGELDDATQAKLAEYTDG